MPKPIKIVHFSDWHGQWYKLPKADIYVCTGDMLKNYPKIDRWGGYKIVKSIEIKCQNGWLNKQITKGGLRRFLGSPEAPVICVRGNHDFVSFARGFGGDVSEIDENSETVFEIKGLRFSGFRGINALEGRWSDELEDAELFHRVNGLYLSKPDVVVTHAPPENILDLAWGKYHCGIKSLATYINNSLYLETSLPKLFCFGHIHEGKGTDEYHWPKEQVSSIFSNAATTHNTLEI